MVSISILKARCERKRDAGRGRGGEEEEERKGQGNIETNNLHHVSKAAILLDKVGAAGAILPVLLLRQQIRDMFGHLSPLDAHLVAGTTVRLSSARLASILVALRASDNSSKVFAMGDRSAAVEAVEVALEHSVLSQLVAVYRVLVLGEIRFAERVFIDDYTTAFHPVEGLRADGGPSHCCKTVQAVDMNASSLNCVLGWEHL